MVGYSSARNIIECFGDITCSIALKITLAVSKAGYSDSNKILHDCLCMVCAKLGCDQNGENYIKKNEHAHFTYIRWKCIFDRNCKSGTVPIFSLCDWKCQEWLKQSTPGRQLAKFWTLLGRNDPNTDQNLPSIIHNLWTNGWARHIAIHHLFTSYLTKQNGVVRSLPRTSQLVCARLSGSVRFYFPMKYACPKSNHSLNHSMVNPSQYLSAMPYSFHESK